MIAFRLGLKLKVGFEELILFAQVVLSAYVRSFDFPRQNRLAFWGVTCPESKEEGFPELYIT